MPAARAVSRADVSRSACAAGSRSGAPRTPGLSSRLMPTAPTARTRRRSPRPPQGSRRTPIRCQRSPGRTPRRRCGAQHRAQRRGSDHPRPLLLPPTTPRRLWWQSPLRQPPRSPPPSPDPTRSPAPAEVAHAGHAGHALVRSDRASSRSPPGSPGVGGGDAARCWWLRSDADEQIVVDLDELDDQIGELAGDELPVHSGTRVGVVGRLVGEVLDEQQVVGVLGVAVDAERQRAVLLSGAPGERRP